MLTRSFSFFVCSLVCLLAALGGRLSAGAAMIMLESESDATLYQDDAGSLSNATGRGMFAGTNATGSIRRVLLRFDVSAIPVNAIITSVSLSLSVTRDPSGSPPVMMNLYHVNRAWSEGASNAGTDRDGGGVSAEAGDVTWLHTSHATSFWTVAGGDFDPTVLAGTLVDGIGAYVWSGAGMAADVQDWVMNGTENFGWMLRAVETSSRTARRFATHEESNASMRPMLTIQFQTVPEPARALLLLTGLGALGFKRRRATTAL